MVGINQIMRCGSCHFGKIMAQDITKRVCTGSPPTPVLIMASTGPGRPPEQRQLCVRPIVNVSDEACALYRGKSTDDTVRDVQALAALQQMPAEGETKQ